MCIIFRLLFRQKKFDCQKSQFFYLKNIHFQTKMLLSKILRAADHPYLQGKGGRLVMIKKLRNYKKKKQIKIINIYISNIFTSKANVTGSRSFEIITSGTPTSKKIKKKSSDFCFLQPNNDLRLMQGLSIKSLKHHVALQVITSAAHFLKIMFDISQIQVITSEVSINHF